LVYHIIYDAETGFYSAHAPEHPLIWGQGRSLDGAIDNLESCLLRSTATTDRLNFNIQFDEKPENEIELRAKVSIIV
jgi:predicted RNase H-like HicB family nuclease